MKDAGRELAEKLADIICWDGHQNNNLIGEKMDAARKVLKKHFPDVLKSEMDKVKQFKKEQF